MTSQEKPSAQQQIEYLATKVRKAADKRHYQKHKAKILAQQKAYRQSEAGKKSELRKTKAWAERHPEKRWAHEKVKDALRRGDLVKQPCEDCGEVKAEAHHDDYSKPLDVRWKCRKHHKAFHSQNKL